MKAVAIVDGEHYPDVVREALEELPYEFVGVMLIGGTEKLRGEPDYGVPLVERAGRRGDRSRPLRRAGARPADAVASREPASSRDGIPYVGADFRFDPPSVPSVRAVRRSP